MTEPRDHHRDSRNIEPLDSEGADRLDNAYGSFGGDDGRSDWRSGQHVNDPLDPPSTKRGGCLMIGCAAIFIGGIFMILCTGFGAYRLYMQQVEKYTSEEPLDLPVVSYDEEQLTKLKERLDSFSANMESRSQEDMDDDPIADDTSNEPSQTIDEMAVEENEPEVLELRLTAEDINALIAHEEKLKGRVFVRIEDGKIRGDLSFPLDDILPKGEGRFFNGSVTFEVQLRDGELFVGMDEIRVNGEELPSHFTEELQKKNLAEDAMKDAQTKKLLDQFEKVEVDGDELVVILKPVASRSSND